MARSIRFTQEEIEQYSLYVREMEDIGSQVLRLELVDGDEYHVHGVGPSIMQNLFEAAKTGPEDEFETFKSLYYGDIMERVSDKQDEDRHDIPEDRKVEAEESDDPSPDYNI